MTEQEIETMRYELDAIPAIKAERDAAREAVINNCARVMTVTAERDELRSDLNAASLSAIRQEREIDAYAKAADDMAMSHKVERDALTAANKDLQAWFDVLKADHDKLKDAARLALDLINDLAPLYWDSKKDKKRHTDTVAALKAVL